MIDAARSGSYAYPAVNVSSSETLNAAVRGFSDARSDGRTSVGSIRSRNARRAEILRKLTKLAPGTSSVYVGFDSPTRRAYSSGTSSRQLWPSRPIISSAAGGPLVPGS